MKTRSVLSSFTALAFFACIFHPAAAQQSQERVIRRLPVEKDEPIEITDIKVNGQSVSLDKSFAADDEWLRSLVVSIKNKSDKLILYASIRLQFPRPVGSEERISIEDIYCGNWALQMRTPKAEELSEGIRPGETTNITLTARQFADLRDFLSGTHYPYSIDMVDLRIGKIIFDDDTMWYAGATLRRDQNPSSWTHVHVRRP